MTAAPTWLWAAFTLTAAGGQTLRNALQHDLTEAIGAAGATFVRFLFGLPFSLAFLAAACAFAQAAPPAPDARALWLISLASLAQIAATALMLASMRERSFVITTALMKTEAMQIVAFGLVFMGDEVTWPLALAVLSATAGVFTVSWPRGTAGASPNVGWRSAGYGLASASAFAVSTVGFREGVLALGGASFVVAAATELAIGLVLQTALILLYLSAFDRKGLAAIAAHWRPSLSAGLLGAFATLFWFLAFAVETASRVRTLALIEVILAQIVTRRMFAQTTSAREWLGMAMIIAGVAAALNGG
jgi:drug/metabolite transporter (DMT)-like permease